jgi:hypothetical protein
MSKHQRFEVDEIFNTKIENSKLSFDFETKYEAYQKFAFDDIKGIDLVISDLKNHNYGH